MANYLVTGDAMEPGETDLIAQTASLRVGLPVPDGWRVLTGNAKTSLIGRLAYRYECEDDAAQKERAKRESGK